MLTISQVAKVAGVTVRAVRHYHARGLLPEPGRDASGYRRYDAQAVVDLIRIRTLAEAGVPLARVHELLHAGDEEFARAVREIDARLRAEVRRLQQHRERVAQLRSADGIALPREVELYLGELRAAGLSERVVTLERDGWVLLAGTSPAEQVQEWIARKRASLGDDAQFWEMYRRFDAAYGWDRDDPRLPALVDDLVRTLGRIAAEHPADDAAQHPAGQPEDGLDPQLGALLDAGVLASSPAWTRIVELLPARGWVGWSDVGAGA